MNDGNYKLQLHYFMCSEKTHFNEVTYHEIREMEKSKVLQNLCTFSRSRLKTEHSQEDLHMVEKMLIIPWDKER